MEELMTFKEEIAQIERQRKQLAELSDMLTEPWDTTPERTEAEELRVQLQHATALLQRIADDAEAVEGFVCRKYECILDSALMESIKTAAKYPATLPPVAAPLANDDNEECPF